MVRAWPGERNNLLYINSKEPTTMNIDEVIIKSVDSIKYPAITQLNDIIVRNGLVQVLNQSAAPGFRLLTLSYNLDLVNAIGLLTGSPTDPLVFFGPKRFLNGYDNRIFVVDENVSFNRIISS